MKFDVEWLHDNEYINDNFYYILNGKTAQENFADFVNKRMAQNDNKFLEQLVEKSLKAAISTTFKSLLK